MVTTEDFYRQPDVKVYPCATSLFVSLWSPSRANSPARGTSFSLPCAEGSKPYWGCFPLNRRSRPRSLDELLGGIVQNAALTPLGAVNIEQLIVDAWRQL